MADQTEAGKASRFSKYIEGLKSVIGHPRRAERLRDYCAGLLLSGGRRSVEPMAALTATTRERVPAQHQSLLHFVGEGSWSDEQVLAKVREMVQPEIERHGSIKAWIIDDTSFPKQGQHSVGVARQYCGQLGKKANCQALVSLTLARGEVPVGVGLRLYLPQAWVEDAERRARAGVPEGIGGRPKWQIALDEIDRIRAAGARFGAVLADADYGRMAEFRRGLSDRDLAWAV